VGYKIKKERGGCEGKASVMPDNKNEKKKQ
jgi:hypothetical protein